MSNGQIDIKNRQNLHKMKMRITTPPPHQLLESSSQQTKYIIRRKTDKKHIPAAARPRQLSGFMQIERQRRTCRRSVRNATFASKRAKGLKNPSHNYATDSRKSLNSNTLGEL